MIYLQQFCQVLGTPKHNRVERGEEKQKTEVDWKITGTENWARDTHHENESTSPQPINLQ